MTQLTQLHRCLLGVVAVVLWTVSQAAASSTTATAKVAMALQGGGFRAHCTDTGLIVGLLGYLGFQQKLSAPTLENTELLSRFDTFATNSGSTWFFSELAYSKRFGKLIESMAASPQTAGDQFNEQWFDPFKKATDVQPSIFNLKRDLAEWLVTVLLGKGDEDTIFAMQFILATNSTWNEFVKVLLSSTASVDRNMTLASPVGSWATGKYWLVDHTLLLPSKHHRAYMFTKNVNLSRLDFYQTATYYANGSGSIPLLAPAKFSMTLGEGPNSSAPFPYIASTALHHLESFQYNGVAIPIFDEPSDNSGVVNHTDFARDAISRNTGSLPIWGVAAASSGCFGGASVATLPVNQVLAQLNHADLTPWVSRAPDGASFSTASELIANMRMPFGVRQGSVSSLAADAVHGVIDGGYSDGTALGTAISAGAEEVVLFLNSGVVNGPFYLKVLCKDGPAPDDPLTPKELFPLFETTAATVQKTWSAFHELKLSNDTVYVKRFLMGTINMTTADNEYFGLKAGRNITVHIVHICSTLNIGFFEKYVNFGELTQEIAATIVAQENSELVSTILVPMMLGKQFKGKGVPSIII